MNVCVFVTMTQMKGETFAHKAQERLDLSGLLSTLKENNVVIACSFCGNIFVKRRYESLCGNRWYSQLNVKQQVFLGCFCERGKKLFFFRLTRVVEAPSEEWEELSESVFCHDNELFLQNYNARSAVECLVGENYLIVNKANFFLQHFLWKRNETAFCLEGTMTWIAKREISLSKGY